MKKVSRYRVKSLGLTIERSLKVELCENKSDQEIAEMILSLSAMFFVLEGVRSGQRPFSIRKIR